MRILYIAPRFHPNQYPIVEGLLSKGHEVFFCVSKIGETEKHDNVKIKVVKPNSRTNERKERWLNRGTNYTEDKLIFWFEPDYDDMINYLKQVKPNIVIIRDRNMFSLSAVRMCRKLGIKKILLYNQSPVWSTEESILKKIQKNIWFSLFPKKRITVCRYKEYPVEDVKYYEDKNATFLPFVARTTTQIKSEFMENGVLNVLDCGKYRPYKNHFVLVEAANQIVKNGKTNVHFTIVGQKENQQEQEYYQNLLNRIRELHLEEYFTLMGAVTYDEMQSLFLKNDVFVLTSIRELANVSILDAMSYGVPVIATNANGTSDYVTPGKTGYIFETGNSKELANMISIYYDSPELLKEHSNHAIESVKNNHSFEKYYDGLTDVLSMI